MSSSQSSLVRWLAGAAVVAVMAVGGRALLADKGAGSKDGAGVWSMVEAVLNVFALGPERGNSQQRKGPPSGPPPAVTVSKPITQDVVDWDEYTGRLEAMESVEVRARVAGYLDRVHFKDGQIVKKGDVLYTIDPRPFERTLDQASAEVAQAQTKVENSLKDVERGRPLVDRKIMSDKVFDDRATLKRDAEAALKVAEA